MSNHCTARALNLHHQQIDDGKNRRAMRSYLRQTEYESRWREYRLRDRVIAIYAGTVFCYSALIMAVYMRWWIF